MTAPYVLMRGQFFIGVGGPDRDKPCGHTGPVRTGWRFTALIDHPGNYCADEFDTSDDAWRWLFAHPRFAEVGFHPVRRGRLDWLIKRHSPEVTW